MEEKSVNSNLSKTLKDLLIAFIADCPYQGQNLNEDEIFSLYYFGKILHRYCLRFKDNALVENLDRHAIVLQAFSVVITRLEKAELRGDELYQWCETALKMLDQESLSNIEAIGELRVEIGISKTKTLDYQQRARSAPSIARPDLPRQFPQILISVDDYHKQFKATKSATTRNEVHQLLCQLEARFLYDRCHPWLLKALTLTSPSFEATFQRALALGELLSQAGLYRLAFFWYYQLHEVDAMGYQGELLLAQYLTLHHAIQNATFIPAQPCWEKQRQGLVQLRQTLAKNLSKELQEAIARFNQGLCQWVISLCEQTRLWLGELPTLATEPHKSPEPVRLCLLRLGSLSRGMATAYSDMEYAILLPFQSDADWESAKWDGTPAQQRAWYVKTFTEVLEFTIRNLGESDTGRPGFCLDDNSQPRLELHLRGTPRYVVQKCISSEIDAKDGLVYSLLHADYLYGDETLFEQFQQQRRKVLETPCDRSSLTSITSRLYQSNQPILWHRYWAIAQFKRNLTEYQKYFIEKKEVLDLKKPYSKLLSFMLLDLALYFNLPADDLQMASTQLQTKTFILPKAVLDEITAAIEELLQARCRSALKCGYQNDRPSDDYQPHLDRMHEHLIKPYHNALTLLIERGEACFTQAFWQARASFVFSAQASTCTVRLLTPEHKDSTYYLPSTLINKIFTKTGAIQVTGEERNSAVFTFNEAHCLKILHPDDAHENAQKEALTVFAAREHAINTFSRLLGWQVTAPGCAIQLQYSIAPGQSKTYYAWLTQRILGRDALNAAKDMPKALENILNSDYSALFLLSLLTYPEDGQPRNFIVSPVTGTQFYRLISIDNKRVFVMPFTPVSKLFKLFKDDSLNVKTLLYLLPTFHKTFDVSVLQHCTKLDFSALTQYWLKDLTDFDNAIAKVLPKPEVTSPHQFVHLQIEKSLMYGLPFRLKQIIEKLQSSHLTHQALLQQFEPEVARRYRQLMTTPLATSDFYRVFKDGYRLDAYQQGFSEQTTQFIWENKLRSEQLGKSLLQVYPAFFETIAWAKLSNDDQHQLLSLMKGQALTTLNLTGCRILHEKYLEGLLRNCSQLSVLDISDCPSITADVFNVIARYNRQVKIIRCDGNPHLENLTIDNRLENLKELSLQRCGQLQRVNGNNAKKLKYIAIMHSPHAKVVHVRKYANAFKDRGAAKGGLGRYQEAIADFERAIELQPNNADVFIGRGFAKGSLGRYQEAIADFERAIELQPNNADAFVGRGIAKEGLGRYQEAIEDYDRAIELQPNDANTFHNRGVTKERLGRYQEAIEDYDRAIELQPNNADAFVRCGFAKEKLGRYQEAIEDYDRAIQLQPNDVNAFVGRGNAKRGLGRYQEAIEDYDRAIELQPNDVNAFVGRGNAKGGLGRHQEAFEDFERAIELQPNDVNAFVGRGNAKGGLGRYQEAFEDFERAIELQPNNANAFVGRGTAKFNLGRYQEAFEDYDRAIELQPNNADVFIGRGFAKGSLGRYQEAFEDYDRAIELQPNDANTFHNRGVTKERLGRYQEAIEDYDRAIELQPNNADAFVRCGFAKEKLGRYQEAIEDYDRAIQLQPNDADAFVGRGVTKERLGRYQEAIVDYDRAIELQPNDANAFVGRGVAKYRLGRYQEAILDCDHAIELQPNGANAFYNRAVANYSLSHYPLAIADWETVLQLDNQPFKILAHFYLDFTHQYQGKHEEAIMHCQKTLRQHPKDTHTLTICGLAFYYLDKFEEAVQSYDKALQLDPDNKIALFNRYLAKVKLHSYEEAATDWVKIQLWFYLSTQASSTVTQIAKEEQLTYKSILTNTAIPQQQLGWNCFDVAVGLDRDELVKFALKNSTNHAFRCLLADEIRIGAIAAVTRQKVGLSVRHDLPTSMITDELRNLINDYLEAHDNQALKSTVANCNAALGSEVRQAYNLSRNRDLTHNLSIDDLDDYFKENPEQKETDAYQTFKACYDGYVTHISQLKDYCEREDVYKQYVQDYYGNHEWFAFNQEIAKGKAHSMVDIAAMFLQKQIVIYQLIQGHLQVTYRTQAYDSTVEIEYNGSDHFTQLHTGAELERLVEEGNQLDSHPPHSSLRFFSSSSDERGSSFPKQPASTISYVNEEEKQENKGFTKG